VIRGGEARAQTIALDRDNPAAVDERSMGLKPAIEDAVQRSLGALNRTGWLRYSVGKGAQRIPPNRRKRLHAPSRLRRSAYQSTVHCLTVIVIISTRCGRCCRGCCGALVRRARRLCRPRPGSAAASQAIFHPFESTASHLRIHGLAVAIVLAASAALGVPLPSCRRM
jgi:hypothetical protein